MSASMVFVGARLAKKKLVIYVRNYPRQGRLRWLYKFPMLFSDKVIAIGRELRDLIKEQSPPIIKEKVIHIYNALDIEESKRLMMNNNPDDLKQDLKIPKDKVIISIIALIGPIKRQKDFLKFVVSKIRDNRILFYFIGEVRDEGYMDECREVIREEKIKNVVFAGFFKEIWKWYLVTDILCLPSVREGVPRVLIEAGAYSIPTIAFNIPGNREVIIDNKTGYLVDDFKEFRLRLESLISDNILRKKMANEAQRYIASVFDARLTTNKLEKVYIELTRR
jgi:glycosyltransferase involved in cell wall biosynthesis